jgi:hypothetical protein
MAAVPAAVPAATVAFLQTADQAIAQLKVIPEGGSTGVGNNLVRQKVYQLIQAQTQRANEGAVMNELQCTIHLNLLGTLGSATPADNMPVTLTCGHTFCRGCIQGIFNMPIAAPFSPARKCPICNQPIAVNPAVLGHNVAITEILRRILPQRVGPGGAPVPAFRSRRKHKSTRKNRS